MLSTKSLLFSLICLVSFGQGYAISCTDCSQQLGVLLNYTQTHDSLVAQKSLIKDQLCVNDTNHQDELECQVQIEAWWPPVMRGLNDQKVTDELCKVYLTCTPEENQKADPDPCDDCKSKLTTLANSVDQEAIGKMIEFLKGDAFAGNAFECPVPEDCNEFLDTYFKDSMSILLEELKVNDDLRAETCLAVGDLCPCRARALVLFDHLNEPNEVAMQKEKIKTAVCIDSPPSGENSEACNSTIDEQWGEVTGILATLLDFDKEVCNTMNVWPPNCDPERADDVDWNCENCKCWMEQIGMAMSGEGQSLYDFALLNLPGLLCPNPPGDCIEKAEKYLTPSIPVFGEHITTIGEEFCTHIMKVCGFGPVRSPVVLSK